MLYVLDILKETDEKHPMTANEICQALKAYGIAAERKSVCRDINALMEYYNNENDFGYDIMLSNDNKQGYYMCSRDFEDWELKILIDAVWQAKFLTHKNSKSLAYRLCLLASSESRKVLQNVTPVKSYIKSNNFMITEHIDMLLSAIRKGRKIKFQYEFTDTNMAKQTKYDGLEYLVNPYSLVWRTDHYYLVGNYEKYSNVSFYRLERISNLAITDMPIKPAEDIVGANPSQKIEDLVAHSLYNFVGAKIHLVLRVKAAMVDEILDYFGETIKFEKREHDFFDVRVEVNDGEGLYYWLLQHADNVKVITPDSVRTKLLDKVKKIVNLYDEL